MDHRPLGVDGVVEAIETTHRVLGDFLQTALQTVRTEHGPGMNFDPTSGALFGYVCLDSENPPTHGLIRESKIDCAHCNPDAETWFTLVSFTTGATLRFAASHPARIAEGTYTSQDSRHPINPLDIAAMAGLVEHEYPADDPVVTMLSAAAAPEVGLFAPVTLRTRDELDRFKALLDVRHPAIEHVSVTLQLQSAEEIFELLERAGNRLLSAIDSITPPTDMLALTGNTVSGILRNFDHYDTDTCAALVGLIGHIDIRFADNGDDDDSYADDREQIVASIVKRSVKFTPDGYELLPPAALLDRLLCDQYDIVAGIANAAGKHEDRINTYAHIFRSVLLPIVESSRQAFQIDPALPETDQIVVLLQQAHLAEAGLLVAEDPAMQTRRPELSTTDWVRICASARRIIEATQAGNGPSQPDIDTLTGYGLSADDAAGYASRYKGADMHSMVRQMVAMQTPHDRRHF